MVQEPYPELVFGRGERGVGTRAEELEDKRGAECRDGVERGVCVVRFGEAEERHHGLVFAENEAEGRRHVGGVARAGFVGDELLEGAEDVEGERFAGDVVVVGVGGGEGGVGVEGPGLLVGEGAGFVVYAGVFGVVGEIPVDEAVVCVLVLHELRDTHGVYVVPVTSLIVYYTKTYRGMTVYIQFALVEVS